MFEEKGDLHTENRVLGYVQTGGVYIRVRSKHTKHTPKKIGGTEKSERRQYTCEELNTTKK